MNNWYSIKNKGNTLDLSIHDEIGTWGVTAYEFLSELEDHKDATVINLSINSPGGSVIEGLAIYNALKRHPAKVNANVVALAGSAASFIMMAADHVTMPENSILFIHKAQGVAMGESDDFREVADIMDMYEKMIVNIYMTKATISEDAIRELMAKSSHIIPNDALEYGFIDQVGDSIDIAAKMSGYEKYTGVAEKVNTDISNVREFEKALRESGLSRKLAETLTSCAKVVFQSDPEISDDALNEVSNALDRVFNTPNSNQLFLTNLEGN
ncbi:MAG: Clp protease ClpP [Ketobacter sp.]|nr:Clp protease ClpP [Ketobacter sp.]